LWGHRDEDVETILVSVEFTEDTHTDSQRIHKGHAKDRKRIYKGHRIDSQRIHKGYTTTPTAPLS
jgi:hypothetical protein